jgi:hypothetical protein
VRDVVPGDGGAQGRAEEELWIQNDHDSHRALMLCVAHGLGFAKRVLPPDWFVERPADNGDEPSVNGNATTREGTEDALGGERRDAA